MPNRQIVCLVVGLCLLIGPAAAERYRFQTFGPDEGLSSAVGRVVQDRTGFLWVATSNGLYRYDGVHFQPFGVDEGLPSPLTIHLGTSSDGTLWVLTGRGLARYQHTRFEAVPVGEEGKNAEWQSLSVAGHSVYVGTNHGLRMARIPADGSKPVFGPVPGAPNVSVPGILAAPDGVVWFGCGLHVCRLENSQLERFAGERGLPDDRWTAMLLDSRGNLWVRGIQHLYRKPPGAAIFQPEDDDLPQSSNGAMTVIEDRDGVILVSTDLGLARRSELGWQLIGSKQGLESDAVTAVYQDRQGSLWLSIFGAGLARWNGYGEWSNWNTADGLSNNIVWAIQRHTAGALLVGTDRGLVRLQGGWATKVWKKSDGLGGDKIKAVAVSKDGGIWTGSLPGGVSRIDPKTGAIHVFAGASGLSDLRIIGLRFDSEERLWASTAQGLFRATNKGPNPRFERMMPPGANDATMFYRFHMDSQGRVWVGSTSGLFCWDRGVWTSLTAKDGLRSNAVTHVSQSADGDIWVAYREPLGISRVHVAGGSVSVQNVTKKEGLPGDYILFLGLDSRQHLWVGTDTGVALESAGKWIVYTHDDGLIWDDCAANAFLAEADGTVWIGTLKGLSRFHPKQEPHLPPAVGAAITAVKFGDRLVDPSTVTQVPYADRNFAVYFASLALTGKEVLFRYRLFGQDDRWSETHLRELRYPSLPPGTYRFEVSTRTDAGPWSPAPATVSFRIVPPWWRAWWFTVLALGALASAVAYAIRSRMQATLREHKLLETAVEERTDELRLQKEVVEQQKREIEELLRESQEASKLKSEFLANMSHEIRTPMNAVIGMSELALTTTLDEEQRDYISTVRDSATGLLGVLNDILDFSKIEAGKLALSQEPFHLRKCLAGVMQLFAWQAKEKGLRLSSEVSAGIPEFLVGDADRLRQILVNLLGNALKFTDSGEVSLTVAEVKEGRIPGSPAKQIRFSVRDTGMGIPRDKQAMVFEAFAQADGSTKRRNGGTGLGLAICSGLARLMNGSIAVESAPGQGSEFTVTIAFGVAGHPLEDPHRLANPLPGRALAPLRILLAEDNRVNQKVAQLTIERMGHTIVVVEDGKQAVEAVLREKFDLVLMDIQMPVMDGSEATAAIRERERRDLGAGGSPVHIPIVAMTAHAMSGYREECLRAGMDSYISKPIVLSTLVETLERVRAGAFSGQPQVSNPSPD